jgi:glutaredoxin
VVNRIEITLIGKPGCHLCDDARIELKRVIQAFENGHSGVDVAVTEKNILEDEKLALLHSEEIPVVLINGKMHSYWHVDAPRLTSALEQLSN